MYSAVTAALSLDSRSGTSRRPRVRGRSDLLESLVLQLAVAGAGNRGQLDHVEPAELQVPKCFGDTLQEHGVAAPLPCDGDAELLDAVPVRHPADADLGDFPQSQDPLLYHIRRDLPPADIEDVVAAPKGLEAMSIVQDSEVAGIEPAVLEDPPHGLRKIHVAGHHAVGAHPDPTGLPEGQRPVVLVDHLDADAGENAADLPRRPSTDRADAVGLV